MESYHLGLIGWGVVGGGVVDILTKDADLLRNRTGLDLRLAAVVTADAGRTRAQALPSGCVLSSSMDAILGNPAIRTVIHAVGGTTDAKDVMIACLTSGRNVVTANKALLAVHGDELFDLAQRHKVAIAFEAAVAGGVPVIAALRDGFVANRIDAIHGILNGTCNYILTKMDQDGLGYAEALAQAKQLGYAEADPTLDVNGTDTAHKLAILARIAFGAPIPLAAVRTEGIQSLTFEDIASAKRLGCRIKLIACARRMAAGVDLHVAPALVPLDHPLAAVNRNFNGVMISAANAGPNLFVGQGAGALPTASAVLADVVDVASGRYQHTATSFSFFRQGSALTVIDENHEETGSYARFHVADKPGVLAKIVTTLSQQGASILNIHQEAPSVDQTAMIEVITHPMLGGAFLKAISLIDGAGLTQKPTVCLRRL